MIDLDTGLNLFLFKACCVHRALRQVNSREGPYVHLAHMMRGDQQEPKKHYSDDPDELYTPAIKSTELKFLIALATKLGKPLYETDTKQAFLSGNMGDKRILVSPPDW